MFYYVSKLTWFFVAPSNFLVLLATIGALLSFTRRARRLGSIATLVAALILLAAKTTPLAALLLGPLESRFPDWRAEPKAAPYGIIVLGGGVDAYISATRRYPLEINEAGDRILALIELARAFPAAKLVFTGGAGELLARTGVEADEVKAKIGRYGVDPARILFENESRTTYENAVFTRDLVRPQSNQRWLIVTSAAHMPRSIGVFRRAGFTVEAFPVDFRTPGDEDRGRLTMRATSGLSHLDDAAREWIGLLAYWLSGRTDTLFPAPQAN